VSPCLRRALLVLLSTLPLACGEDGASSGEDASQALDSGVVAASAPKDASASASREDAATGVALDASREDAATGTAPDASRPAPGLGDAGLTSTADAARSPTDAGAPEGAVMPGTPDAATGDTVYPCNGSSAGYDAVVSNSGASWTVVNGGREVYAGTELQEALTRAYASLGANRTSKQKVLVQGSGDVPANAQLAIPSYTVVNVCGTINVAGTPSGSDRSPFYARNARDIEIPNLTLTGSPQYGLFFRQTNNIRLGQIELRLTRSAGIGIRVDSGPSASTQTTFNENLTIDRVVGSGMGSHVVETYGIKGIKIGTVEGRDVGECGLLLNRSIDATIDLVTCTGCATGTGYAAFRVANSVGKVGNAFPAGNIHVRKVVARGGGRGIFSVSGSGGLTIDEIDIADTGNSPILLQNAYNTTLAAKSGTVSKGLIQLSNDTDNTNSGTYPPSQNVTLQNLTLSNGASVRQDWCAQFGKNGCTASNIQGGSVMMCN
jgi:hypothetical protein